MATAAEAFPSSGTTVNEVGKVCMTSTNLCSSHEQEHHAIVIQRHWRGCQARRSMQQLQLDSQTHQLTPAAGPHQQNQPMPKDLQQASGSHPYHNDVWIPAAGYVVRNRGVLKAAARFRAQQGMHQQQNSREWKAFADRQAKRYVPLQSHASRCMLADSMCYCLRIQQLSNLPIMSTVRYGSSFELQLRITLFDEMTGVFYGNTCHSDSIPLAQPQQANKGAKAAVEDQSEAPGVDVDFHFDVYFHSAVSDPRCMAVVEVVMVQKDSAGAAVGGFSIGWAQLPLYSRLAAEGQLCRGQAAAAPIIAGTPRYLLFRSLGDAEVTLPSVIQGSQLTYEVEGYPAMNSVRPLLPPNFLVTYSDTIPGLLRYDSNGQATTSCKGITNTLSNPVLAPAASVSLHGLQLKLPRVLHNLISVLPQLAGVLPPADLPLLLAVPVQPAAVSYTLVAGVHNGRTFVGSQLVVHQLEVQPSPGSVLLKPQVGMQELQLPGVVQDDMVVLVLELLAEPAADQENAQSLGPVLMGRSVIAPFSHISSDGSAATLAEGSHKLGFSCCSDGDFSCPLNLLGGETQGMLPLNWRALFGDTAVRAVPEPVIEFELAAAQLQSVTVPAGQQPGGLGLASTVRKSLPPGAAIPHKMQATADPQRRSAAVSRLGHLRDPMAARPGHLPGETMASMSVRLAAQHLEEAASIPVQESSDEALPDAIPAYQVPVAGQSAGSAMQDQQHLQQLADTMQQQITALARAVEELKEERQTLRSSLTVLHTAVQDHREQYIPDSQAEEGSMFASAQSPRSPTAHRPASPHASSSTLPAFELEQLKAMRPTVQGPQSEMLAFSGAQAAALQGMGAGARHHYHSTPTRTVLQQLHEAGMTRALPGDVQAVLNRSACTANACGAARQWLTDLRDQHGVGTQLTPLMMDIEARDPRTASDVVVQLLAFRPTSDPEAAAQLPAALSSMYFTMQFYDSGPIVTDPCLLVPGDGSTAAGAHGEASHLQQDLCDARAVAGCTDGMQHTYVLMAAQQGQCVGAGLVLKFHVDGSSHGQLSVGQDPGQAAFDSHLAFCRYLATHQLAIDVWDGDSLLQLGTAAVSLQRLLRQGQEYSEVLVEVPVHDISSSNCCASTPDNLAATCQKPVIHTRLPLQLGHMVIRLINIGREPSDVAARVPDCNAAEIAVPTRTAGKKVRVRAAPLEPGSPVARELSMQGSSSPFKVIWQLQQQQHTGDDTLHAWSNAGKTAASDILSFEHRKVARARQLRELLNSSPGQSAPGSPTRSTRSPQTPSNSPARGIAPAGYSRSGSGGDDDPIKAVQRQLLADVDAVRKRQKAGFLRSQLRKDLVTPCAVQPCLGQILLLEHVLHNPLGRDAVFELKSSHPEELKAVESMQEYKQLQVSAAPIITTSPAAAAGGSALQAPSIANLVRGDGLTDAGEQLVSKNRVFLRANEKIGIPLSLRLNPRCAGSMQQEQQQQQRVMTVEFVPLELDYPTNILELQVHPKPLVINRTLRYHTPEKCMLRASVPLISRLGTAAHAPMFVTATAAGGVLTAAASRPDVAVAVSSACTSSGRPEGELSIRFKCGLSPEVVQFYIWIYADACMARPLEVWQVFVHALQKVDMRAVVGQTCSTSLAVAGGTAGDRQVVCYSSNPAELHVTPAVMSLTAGSISALHLTLKPYKCGQELVRVHLVDPSSRQLVHAFLVATEAIMPQISRRLEIECRAGAVTQQQVLYANPYSQQSQGFHRFKFVTNMPWVVSFQPAWLELAPRASKPVSVVIDGRRLKAGAVLEALWFVHDEQDREEECMEVLVVAH